MRQIYNQLKAYIRLYSIAHWLIVTAFLTIVIYLNYCTSYTKYLDPPPDLNGACVIFLVYGIHFYFGFLLYSFFKRDWSYLGNWKFWVLSVAGIAIFAFRSSFIGFYGWIEIYSSESQLQINKRVYGDLFRLVFLMFPVTILWVLFDRRQKPYGFSRKHHKAKIYWLLLLGMVPLVALASTQEDFLAYYPRAKSLIIRDAETWKIWMFELCYGLDFISIEYFFRGFLVLAFQRFIGIHAVMPMALFYVSIHYGKPAGETISSFFGGSILGVISFHSRSVYGGIKVHTGTAWLMEAGGFIGNTVKRVF